MADHAPDALHLVQPQAPTAAGADGTRETSIWSPIALAAVAAVQLAWVIALGWFIVAVL